MAYASGKYSYGLCEYCGRRYPYQELKKNWKGFKVCPQDYEVKEPQLEPLNVKADPVALRQPRPDRKEPLTVFVGAPGDSAFASNGMQPANLAENFSGQAQLGRVTVTTT